MTLPRILTISNAITILRCILVIPIALLLSSQTSPLWILLLLMGIAIATDWFDGYFARKFNQVTELGKILDPIADKIAVGVIAMILTVQERFPFWLLAAVIVRDILILAGGIYLTKKRRLVLQSNWIGKWTVTFIAVCLLLAVIDDQSLAVFTTIIHLITTVLLAGSFLSYVLRFIRAMRLTSQSN
jgi:cardiolipin synthase (CMP-forming)